MSINYNPNQGDEEIVYLCPNCHAELHGSAQDNSVICAECGARFDPGEQQQWQAHKEIE